MEIKKLSSKYEVKKLDKKDIDEIYELCKNNTYFYEHCPPLVTKKSIEDDLSALPPRKTLEDKYYIGFYENQKLIAVMDLILAFPNAETAFMGFFMTDITVQNKGIGSFIIDEVCKYLKEFGFKYIRLGWVKGNEHAEYFWSKNNFKKTGVTTDENINYTVIIGQREL